MKRNFGGILKVAYRFAILSPRVQVPFGGFSFLDVGGFTFTRQRISVAVSGMPTESLGVTEHDSPMEC